MFSATRRNNHLPALKPVTKSGLVLAACILAVFSTSSCTKSDPYGRNTIRVKVTSADTKGTVTTTNGLMSSGSFSMSAYVSDDYIKRDSDDKIIMDGDKPKLFTGGKYFSDDGNVTLSGGAWSIKDAPAWISNVDTHFWAWHPVTAAGRTAPTPVTGTPVTGGDSYPYTGELRFSYTTPTPNGSTDADKAVDLLFAYSKKKYVDKKNPSDSDKTINITFHHALSQVRFCVSTDDGTFDKNLKIKSISMTNLKTKGDASFTDSGNAENNQYAHNPKQGSYDQFVWTNQSTPATFGQTYNADFSATAVTGWTKDSYSKNGSTYNLYTCENVFFMIPQTVERKSTDSDSNMLTVVFDYNGKDTTRSVPITGESSSVGDKDTWIGDHYYTYKINATRIGRDIDFSVSLVGWTNRKEEIFI